MFSTQEISLETPLVSLHTVLQGGNPNLREFISFFFYFVLLLNQHPVNLVWIWRINSCCELRELYV